MLDAQLQSAISLTRYAEIAATRTPPTTRRGCSPPAKAMLPRFDTGHWSRYSIGADSTLEYHDFVVDLLNPRRPPSDDPVWTDALKRFQLYESEPPELTAPAVTPLVYPRPEDGVRDDPSSASRSRSRRRSCS